MPGIRAKRLALSHFKWVMREEIHRNSPLIKGQGGCLKILYNPELKQRAGELRKQGVLSEVLFWNQLKYRKMRG